MPKTPQTDPTPPPAPGRPATKTKTAAKTKPQAKTKTKPVVARPQRLPATADQIRALQGEGLHPRDPGFWTPGRRELVKKLCAPKATPEQFELFLFACKTTNLNPLMRQIYCVIRPEAQEDGSYQDKLCIQVGIDGYRLIAERTGKFMGETPVEFFDQQAFKKQIKDLAADDQVTIEHGDGLKDGEVWCGRWVQAWARQYKPAAARVGVLKRDNPVATYGIAHAVEYQQRKKGGDLTFMWQKYYCGQLGKCAEALALRKAFPQELSGIYIHDEMPETNQVPSQEVVDKAKADYEREITRLSVQFHIVASKAGYPKEEHLPRLRAAYPYVVDSAKDCTAADLKTLIAKLERQAQARTTRRGQPVQPALEKGGADAKK